MKLLFLFFSNTSLCKSKKCQEDVDRSCRSEHDRKRRISIFQLRIIQQVISHFLTGMLLIYAHYTYCSSEIPSQPWYDSNDTQENNEKVKTAYRSVYVLTPWSEAELATDDDSIDNTNKGAIYLEGIYDGMLMYANIINHTLKADEEGLLPNQSIRGVEVIGKALGLNFTGKLCHIRILERLVICNVYADGYSLGFLGSKRFISDCNVTEYNDECLVNTRSLNIEISGHLPK